MMEPDIGDSMEAGHIGGTSHRNLLRTNEKWRDLGRRSDDASGMSALVQKTCARDPAYRPTCFSSAWRHPGTASNTRNRSG
jgi:hypothetical protein